MVEVGRCRSCSLKLFVSLGFFFFKKKRKKEKESLSFGAVHLLPGNERVFQELLNFIVLSVVDFPDAQEQLLLAGCF